MEAKHVCVLRSLLIRNQQTVSVTTKKTLIKLRCSGQRIRLCNSPRGIYQTIMSPALLLSVCLIPVSGCVCACFVPKNTERAVIITMTLSDDWVQQWRSQKFKMEGVLAPFSLSLFPFIPPFLFRSLPFP